jgi:hypothetical protein
MFKRTRTTPPRDEGERLIDAWEQAVLATIAANTEHDPAAAIDATRATREAAAQLRQDYRRSRARA